MNEYRITGLELNGVGIFDTLNLSFPEKLETLKDKAEIHIFTGINGTGKTTLLQALTYFDLFINTTYYFKINDGEDFQHPLQAKFISETAIVKINFEADQFIAKILGGRTIPAILQSYGQIIDSSQLYIHKYSHLQYAFFAYSGIRELTDSNKTKAMREIPNYAILRDALDISSKEINSDLFQWILNCRTKSAIAYQRNDSDSSNHYILMLEKIEKAISEIIGRKKVEFIIDEQSLLVTIQLDGLPYLIAFEQLAEGYKSIISWLADLMYRLDSIGFKPDSPFALFLDEIDVHLHPAAQRRILPVIQKLFPNAQIFLTTHSPFVLGSVDGAWIYKFKFDEKGNSVLDGDGPILSEDGYSYSYIIEDILGVKENFGVEVEELLSEFKKEKDKLLKGESEDAGRLLSISRELAPQSIELESIIGFELRQLERITKREYII